MVFTWVRRRKRRKPERLNSKRVRWVLYSPESRRLTVWNSSWRKSVHHGVSEGVYEKLRSADPPDFYYNTYIAEASPRRSAPARLLTVALIAVAMFSVAYLERWI